MTCMKDQGLVNNLVVLNPPSFLVAVDSNEFEPHLRWGFNAEVPAEPVRESLDQGVPTRHDHTAV